MRIKCLDQGCNIVMLSGHKPSPSVSRNRHPNHMTNMPMVLIMTNKNSHSVSKFISFNKNYMQNIMQTNLFRNLLMFFDFYVNIHVIIDAQLCGINKYIIPK